MHKSHRQICRCALSEKIHHQIDNSQFGHSLEQSTHKFIWNVMMNITQINWA
uniref:Uncharacterized protein n=1 Tax=Anguilla anguilla TaxID=7936 RepID=A0A0E9W846_ANGAN